MNSRLLLSQQSRVSRHVSNLARGGVRASRSGEAASRARTETREMAKKTRIRGIGIERSRDGNSRGSTNWIRKQLVLVSTQTHAHTHAYVYARTHARTRARVYAHLQTRLAHVLTCIGAYATAHGHGGIFTCSNSARAVKLAVSLYLHYYVNHNVRQ